MKNSGLKNCRVCGAEVAKEAKVCPHCGAKLKKGHPILVAVLVIFVIIGAISTSGGSDEPQRADTPVPPQSGAADSTQPEGESRFRVGETAELKGVRVTLVDVTESTGSTFNTPTDGNVFVLCEFAIANDSDREINVSSAMSFEAYCDDYTCTFSLGALLEKGNQNQLDGTVAPGKKFNGVIGYEVPTDWKELEIRFTPDFWSGKDITFIATND